MSAQSRPSATSLMVKSNSLRATKSMALEAVRVSSGSHRDLGADQPTLRGGLAP